MIGVLIAMASRGDIFSLRLPPGDRLRLEELAARYGAGVSNVAKVLIGRELDALYDSDGNLSGIRIGRERVDRMEGYYPAETLEDAYGIDPGTVRRWAEDGSVRSAVRGMDLYVSLGDVEGRLHGEGKT